jgi:hypothetical protein
MGMYTEFFLRVRLRRNTPVEIIDTLDYMLRDKDRDEQDFLPPAHPLFETTRWNYMLRMYVGDGQMDSRLSRKYGDIHLRVHTSLKNYENEIEKFVDWLTPYIDVFDDGQFLGWKQYEEWDAPAILVHPNRWLFLDIEKGRLSE